MSHTDHKASVLMLYSILKEETTEEHPLSTNQLIDRIGERYGLRVHRTTVASDIELLRQFGVDIVTTRSRQNLYHLAFRTFELTELKLLVDAVNSSRLITEKKSGELVGKLATLTDASHAAELSRTLYKPGTAKSSNEKVYYILDGLYDAIRLGRKVSFLYYEYGPDRQPRVKNGGNPYFFSPYALLWKDDFYYVVGFSDKHEQIIALRVDRIGYPVELTDEAAVPQSEGIEPESYYGNHVIQMFKGEDADVVLCCENDIMKNVIDRFGDGVETWITDENHFSVCVNVSVSQTFFAWVFTFREKMKIAGPPDVREKFLAHMRTVTALYDDNLPDPGESMPSDGR